MFSPDTIEDLMVSMMDSTTSSTATFSIPVLVSHEIKGNANYWLLLLLTLQKKRHEKIIAYFLFCNADKH